MNEEQYLKDHIGQRNPFSVPDGYFDSFSSKLMDQLPAQRPKPGLTARLRPLMYAAACFLAVLFTAAVYFTSQDGSAPTVASASTADTYVDDAADYVMADNIDIYACLTTDY